MNSISSVQMVLKFNHTFIGTVYFFGFTTFMLNIMGIILMVAMYESAPTEGDYEAVLKFLNYPILISSFSLLVGMGLYALTFSSGLAYGYLGLFAYIFYKIYMFFSTHKLP